MHLNQRYRKYHFDVKDFKINHQIKSGAFGTVYSVKNTKTNKILAAKVINAALDENRYKKMINQEIGIMIRCQHPTIIKFYGFSSKDFVDQQNVTIFMEFAQKGSLYECLEKVRKGLSDVFLDNTARQIILVGIARGMMHLHQNGVIHRDLKPGNILLDENMRPLITDFGLSKINENQSIQSQQCGTSIYMAPEVHTGKRYNGKADVYSFGILMYEVVTDLLPFPLFQTGKMPSFNFINKVVNDDYRPEFTVPVKGSIKELIERCWAKNPNERPTFEELFKKLAYNIEDAIDDIYSEIKSDTNDDDRKYYLDDVDEDEVIFYAEDIDKKNGNDINDFMAQVSELKNIITPIQEENEKLKKDNEFMKKKLDEITKENEKMKFEQEQQKKEIKRLNDEINLLKSNKILQNKEDINHSSKSQTNPTSTFSKSQVNINPSENNPSLPITPQNKSQQVDDDCVLPPNGIFSPSSSDSFTGIFNYFRKITKNRLRFKVETTASSTYSSRYEPRYVLIFDDKGKEFASKDEPNSWLCFYFKENKIIPSYYQIMSYEGKKNYNHPRNWVIEGSNNKNDWINLDTQNECNYLNGRNLSHIFSIENQKQKEFRYIRMKLTGKCWSNCHFLEICSFEIYGKLINI